MMNSAELNDIILSFLITLIREIIMLNVGDEKEIIELLREILYPGASDKSIKLVQAYCRFFKLDPFLKVFHIVQRYDSKTKSYKDIIMPAIAFYRIMAHRSGQYVGIDNPVFGPDITESIGGITVTYPQYCTTSIYRLIKGVARKFSHTEYWKENFAKRGGKDNPNPEAPNSMWMTRSHGQLAKCAEMGCLKKTFPEMPHVPINEMEEDEVQPQAISAPVQVHKIERVPAPIELIDKLTDLMLEKNVEPETFNKWLEKANAKDIFDFTEIQATKLIEKLESQVVKEEKGRLVSIEASSEDDIRNALNGGVA